MSLGDMAKTREVLVDLGDDSGGEDGKDNHRTLGVGLVGATNLDIGDQPGVYVSRVDDDCTAALHVGDQILSVATTDWRIDTTASTLPEVLDHLKDAMQAASVIKLVVRQNQEGFAAFRKVVEHNHGTTTNTAEEDGHASPANQHAKGPASSSLSASRAPGSAQQSATTRHQTVTTDASNEDRHVWLGIDALVHHKPEEAEAHFAAALQVTLDDALEQRIAALAATSDPAFAQKAWQKDLEELKRHKGYIHYLHGVAFTHAQRPRWDAQHSMLEATRVLLPWYYHPSLLINLSDADFHHTVSRVLINKGLYRSAIIAISEARRIRGEDDYLADELSFARHLLAQQQQYWHQQQQQQRSDGDSDDDEEDESDEDDGGDEEGSADVGEGEGGGGMVDGDGSSSVEAVPDQEANHNTSHGDNGVDDVDEDDDDDEVDDDVDDDDDDDEQ
ncbi:hypothetical protein PTSG_04468 [Salpingoeca rosetta]|uniref:PDZ domain-containing protein n=1 Tax=Salpingoeca rosetta (strain ATCC 50818 / BSB-021) TaxID=946362 RepID=F2U8N1_SALR5|nr:uncharacterized protein PTSG_04468 [Salpingoeca rosetta]EGD72739.1 hypothetical protein PTSG_04468 [Salpingoeca rosetta]|eukprot:XP_004994562.1 hypothetical protein PTSG_04468 [Salpingoeca rosetta]